MVVMLFLLSANNLQAQIAPEIDGNPQEWDDTNIIDLPSFQYQLDPFGHGVVDDQFTTGSKDFMELGNLADQFLVWTFGQTKAKNDIANAAAVVVTDPFNPPPNVADPHGTFLYFAGDRISNNGDAQIGFWFYINGSGPFKEDGEKNGYFTPIHSEGDLLVLSDFTGGGRDATVIVYEWVGFDNGGDSGPDNQLLLRSDIDASVAQNNKVESPVPGGWMYPSENYELNAFYEGYVDLTGVLTNVNQICNASWLLETRSSQELTASLDDFVGRQFNLTPIVSVNSPTICESIGTAEIKATVYEGDELVEDPEADGYTFSWTLDGGFFDEDGPSFIADVAGEYCVVVTNSNLCPSVETCGTFTINGGPACSIQGDLSTCPGTTGIIYSGPVGDDLSYEWSIAGNGSINGATNGQTVSVDAGASCGVDFTLTLTVTDGNGCSTTCNMNFSVNDDTAPELDEAPDDVSVQCIEDVPAASSLNWTDNCDGEGMVQGSDSTDGQTCPEVITRTWSYTDACGNETSVSQTITVNDTIDPEIINLPEVGTICNDGFPESLNADWTDNCADGGMLTAYPENIRYREDNCAEFADYVFTAIDDCENEVTETITIEREFDKIGNCETAFARDTETSSCFIPDFRRWGWTNAYNEGAYSELPLYAGAAHCDYENKGTLVGSVTVDYTTEGQVTVTYNIDEGYVMSEAHVYVGCDLYPTKNETPTVAPGQYTFNAGTLDSSTGISVTFTSVYGPINVIAHAVTCEELCRCSDRPGVDDGKEYFMDLGITCPGGTEKVTATKEVNFTAYPVPFDKEVNIKYSFSYDTDVKIEVYDIKGALLRTAINNNYVKGTQDKTTLDLSRTANQLFFVKLTTRNGTVVKKIVSSSLKR